MVNGDSEYALRVAELQVADSSAGGWPPEGRIVVVFWELLVLSIQCLPDHGTTSRKVKEYNFENLTT
jgi:hypothetical protein